MITKVPIRGWQEHQSQKRQCGNASRGQRKGDLKMLALRGQEPRMQMPLESGKGREMSSQRMQPC